MKPIKVAINFTANGKNYIKGDEIKNLSFRQIVKLNELGFIEPLTFEDLTIIKREIEKPIIKEEK